MVPAGVYEVRVMPTIIDPLVMEVTTRVLGAVAVEEATNVAGTYVAAVREPVAPALAATLMTHVPVEPGKIVTAEAGLAGPALSVAEATANVVAVSIVHCPVCPTAIDPTDVDAQNFVDEAMVVQVVPGHAVHEVPAHSSMVHVA